MPVSWDANDHRARYTFDISAFTDTIARWTTAANDMTSSITSWYESLPPVTRRAIENQDAMTDPDYARAANSGAPEAFLAAMRKRRR